MVRIARWLSEFGATIDSLLQVEADGALAARLLGAKLAEHGLRLAGERLQILGQSGEILPGADAEHGVGMLVQGGVDPAHHQGFGWRQTGFIRGRKILLTVRRAAFAQAEFGIEGFSCELRNDVLPSSNMRCGLVSLDGAKADMWRQLLKARPRAGVGRHSKNGVIRFARALCDGGHLSLA